jgi:Flp pilus assembly pilin Flp
MKSELSRLLDDESATSSVEYVLLTGLVVLPLFFTYRLFWTGLQSEFKFLCFLLSQAAP